MNYPGMVPSKGTLLSFSPVAGVVGFTDGEDKWTLPMLGWGVVVCYIEQMGDTGQWEYDTMLEPMVLTDAQVLMPVGMYLRSTSDNTTWRVIL